MRWLPTKIMSLGATYYVRWSGLSEEEEETASLAGFCLFLPSSAREKMIEASLRYFWSVLGLYTKSTSHTTKRLARYWLSANSSKMPPQSNGDVSSAGSSGAMGDQQQHQERHALSATVSISTNEIPVIDLENPDTSLLIDQVSVRLRMATWK